MFAHLTHVDRDGRRQLFEDTDAGRDVLRRGRGQRRCRRQKTSGVIVRRRHQGLDGGERARLRGPSHARCGPVGTSHMPRQGGGGFAGRESAELGHGKGRRSFALEMSSFRVVACFELWRAGKGRTAFQLSTRFFGLSSPLSSFGLRKVVFEEKLSN